MNVTIVGAGVIGQAVAFELASRGASVRIVDPRGTGLGATRASAGVLAPYIEGHSDTFLRLAVSGLACYDDFIARVESQSGQRIEYRRSGTLQVARDAAEAADLEAIAARLSAADVPHSLLDGAGAMRLEPGLAETISAGLLVPFHGYVVAAQLMAALARATERLGVTMSTRSVQRIEQNGCGFHVVSASELFQADAVVIAAGSWSGQISAAPAPDAPVRPIRGQLLHARFPRPPLSRVVWGSACYLVPWEDGSVLVGATVEDVGFNERATVGGIRHLLTSAGELLPATTSAQFSDVRVGLRPLTADELPVIGASSTMRGVYYATGHYRNGVLLAPLTAMMLADLMLEGRQRPEMTLVKPDRFRL